MLKQIDSQSLTLVPSPSISLTKSATGSVQSPLMDRMILPDAVEAVGRLIALFPNGTPANAKGYIGGLAAILVSYPRTVAERASDPLKGVARETRFLPTPADLIAWCERETEKLRASIDLDDRMERARLARTEQIQRRNEEEQQLIEDRKQRPTLAELKAKFGPNWGLTLDEPKREQRTISSTRLFERAAARGGHDAGSGFVISPYLVEAIRGPQTEGTDQ